VHAPLLRERTGIFGHSMGGHGALTLALRHPGVFASLSALAPICAPTQCAWGVKAFSGYLGEDRSTWLAHDASALMRAQTQAPYPHEKTPGRSQVFSPPSGGLTQSDRSGGALGILIDQGLADPFLADQQLKPEAFEAACAAVAQPLTLRRHKGYDHGYYFIASWVEDHLRHHARVLALN
jgi:S-formylglutathione hydrolase